MAKVGVKRSSNFSFSERSLLIKIALKSKAVLENKKTDAITWRQKEEEWNKIEKEFNSYSNGEVSVPQNYFKIMILTVPGHTNIQ